MSVRPLLYSSKICQPLGFRSMYSWGSRGSLYMVNNVPVYVAEGQITGLSPGSEKTNKNHSYHKETAYAQGKKKLIGHDVLIAQFADYSSFRFGAIASSTQSSQETNNQVSNIPVAPVKNDGSPGIQYTSPPSFPTSLRENQFQLGPSQYLKPGTDAYDGTLTQVFGTMFRGKVFSIRKSSCELTLYENKVAALVASPPKSTSLMVVLPTWKARPDRAMETAKLAKKTVSIDKEIE
jgi:hypothetical protein